MHMLQAVASKVTAFGRQPRPKARERERERQRSEGPGRGNRHPKPRIQFALAPNRDPFITTASEPYSARAERIEPVELEMRCGREANSTQLPTESGAGVVASFFSHLEKERNCRLVYVTNIVRRIFGVVNGTTSEGY